jgi:transposase
MKQDVITLNQKQLVRLDMINQANSGFITVNEAALALGLSRRQVQRLKKEVKEYGAAALIHKNSLKPPYNALTQQRKDRILEIRKLDIFKSSNFAHFRDLLDEHFDIQISYATLHKLMTDQKIVSPKKKRKYKPHRRRKRLPQAGLMLQLDGTPFAWFNKSKTMYCLHGAIDDATGQITALYMCKNECLYGYFHMFQMSIKNYGIPISVYADRHTIFRSPNQDKSEIDPTINVADTQFGMAMKDLCVQIIPARSPQAKGRIERLWGTLQSRLPVEFALRDITTMAEANEFLKTYIYEFNSQFAVEPQVAQSVFRKPDPSINLDYVFSIREQRIIDAGGIFSYRNKTFKVEDGTYAGRLAAKTKITVLLNPDLGELGMKAMYKGLLFDVTRFVPEKRKKSEPKNNTSKQKHPIAKDHPWHRPQTAAEKFGFTTSDREILSMLEDAFLK